VSERRPITADELFGAGPIEPGSALEGPELVRAYWRIKGREKDLARQERFWATTNHALARAYEELEQRSDELKRTREALLALNVDLEQRVAAQVVEIVGRARDVEALNVQLRAQVQERSRELAAALRRLSHQSVETAVGPGDVVGGRVRVGSVIGRGGMGTVYLGEDLLTGRPVALKVMNTEIGTAPDVLARFINEAAATASIDHPGVIKTLHVDVSADGRLYQIMEYVAGPTLTRILAQGPLGIALAARAGAVIAEALSAAHALNVVHRDIKASNLILCNQPPGVRILDFGLAKLLDETLPRTPDTITRTGQILGTPAYMSPEQIKDFASITPRTDVYSLGVVLYEMASGTLPFQANDSAAYIVAHLTHPPPDVRALLPDAPEAFADLVRRCMAKEASDRPTAEVLARELCALADALKAPPVEAIVDAQAHTAAVAPTLVA